MAKKKEEMVTEVEESPPEAILDTAKPKRMNELDGFRATKKLKAVVRALGGAQPFLDFTNFVKEYSDKMIYGRLAGFFDEACSLLGSTSLEVTVDFKMFQIKPEHGLETRGIAWVEGKEPDKWNTKMSDAYPDGIEFVLYSKDRKKKCAVKAFMRHGLFVTWFNQTLTVS